MITISIELTDEVRSAIIEKNGRKYLNMVVTNLKEVDQYGNTHTVYLSQSKEQRENKVPRKYIGKGKDYSKPAESKPQVNSAAGDLPF